jgi:magnesium chelatase family protein
MDCFLVTIETDISFSLPKFHIVGLGDTAVQESRERVRSAIKNSGFLFPPTKITVNLAPADRKKIGVFYDLPIALGILLTSESILVKEDMSRVLCIGELALDGCVRPVRGIISLLLFAKEHGYKSVIIPFENKEEASLIQGVDIFPVKTLQETVFHLTGEKRIPPYTEVLSLEKKESSSINFSSVYGQYQAKRALEISAAGSHNVLLCGSPGSGKTLLSQAYKSILPPLSEEECLEVTKIYSLANKLSFGIIQERPFRIIHHTASAISLVGGGSIPFPGEISLAHRGILFLDEVPEFPSHTLEVLRQPLEDKKICITRASGSIEFPAHFTLIGAMNPCPCGYHNVLGSAKPCTCSPSDIERYQKKISGPFLDRIDLYVSVSPVPLSCFQKTQNEESSEDIQKRVLQAREIQKKRFQSQYKVNTDMNEKEL